MKHDSTTNSPAPTFSSPIRAIDFLAQFEGAHDHFDKARLAACAMFSHCAEQSTNGAEADLLAAVLGRILVELHNAEREVDGIESCDEVKPIVDAAKREAQQ